MHEMRGLQGCVQIRRRDHPLNFSTPRPEDRGLLKVHPEPRLFTPPCRLELCAVKWVKRPLRGKKAMIHLMINGLPTSAEPGATLLEAARFLGFPSHLVSHGGPNPLWSVSALRRRDWRGALGETRLSCTYPVQEGLQVRTASSRVIQGAQDDPGAAPGLVLPIKDHPGLGFGL